MGQVGDDAVENVTGDAWRPDLHPLSGDEADDRHDRGLVEVHREHHDAPEVGPRRQLLAVPPDGLGAVALCGRIVPLLVAARAEVEVARAAPVGDVVGTFHGLVADVALVALEPDLEEQLVHVQVRDLLALLLGQFFQVVAYHEVLRVDREHDDGEQGPLERLDARIVVEADALEPVVHRHRRHEAEGHGHHDGLLLLRLLHQHGVISLRLEEVLRRRRRRRRGAARAGPRGRAVERDLLQRRRQVADAEPRSAIGGRNRRRRWGGLLLPPLLLLHPTQRRFGGGLVVPSHCDQGEQRNCDNSHKATNQRVHRPRLIAVVVVRLRPRGLAQEVDAHASQEVQAEKHEDRDEESTAREK
mmetsp:Transcript_79452/g.199683  ORF Transcript_79452/g.199683 Transcript_79452/m.199683 type:complete len:358 (+) Transcript_79452:1863-2936(+)